MGGQDITSNVTVEDEEQEPAPREKIPPASPTVVPEPVKELLERLAEGFKEQQKVAQYLQSRVHKYFTMSADDLYALGYFDTSQRIKLSSLIGDLLKGLEEKMGSELATVVSKKISETDLVALVGALEAKAMKEHWYSPFWEVEE